MFATSGMTSPAAHGGTAGAALWDVLRKEARKLEGEVDSKLAAFSKLGGDKPAALLGDGSEQLVAVRGEEIEALLQRLSDVNDAMSSAVTSAGDARAHTLARHRDILLEFTQEFRRVRNNLVASREHAALLGGRSGDSAQLVGVQIQGGASNTTQLLRERGYIHSSTAQLDDVIGQAQAAVSSLAAQRTLFTDITSKLGTVGAKFPVVNSLVTAIRRKKSKDTIILSAVVAGCTLFLLVYWSSK